MAHVSIAEVKRSRAALKKERKTLLEEAKALLQKQDDSDGDMSDEDKDRFAALEKSIADHDGRIGEHDARIDRLEKMQELEARAAEEDDDEDKAEDDDDDEEKSFKRSNVVIRRGRPKGELKGTRFARFIIGAGINAKQGSNAGSRYVQQHYEDDEVFKALNTTTQSSGGALIPQTFRAELIELLTAEAVVRGSGVRVYPMETGNLTVPRQSGGAAAKWQGELDDISLTEQTFDDIQFTAKKLTALVPVSNDMIRRSPLSVEAIVREDMVTQLRLAEDSALLLSDGTLKRPVGLVHLATFYNSTNSTAPTLTVVNNELQHHELNLRSANVPMTSARWFFNPALRSFLNTLTDNNGRYFFQDELRGGTLSGFPYSMTNQLPSNLGTGGTDQYLILAAMDQFILADTMSMLADSSSDATYVSGGSTVSAYQRDQTLFRVIEEIDFGARHNRAVSVSTVTGWMPTGFTGVAGAPYSTQPQDTTKSSAGSANPV